MKIVWKEDNGPILIEPTVFKDDRGYFYESFNEKNFNELTGADFHPVQDNQSKSDYGVLRGMHFQQGTHAQSKLVRVINGSVIDVVIDARPLSPKYGNVYWAFLSAENMRQFYVPKGFAHGFITLQNDTVFQYKCDAYYCKESEGAYAWDSINFDWNSIIDVNDIILSEKDKNHPHFPYDIDEQ